ncbi:uncharacterized protein CIMG_07968 [Coccidioides immitis RS]|uniref:Uncharacterized protein n=1 Tax=Coccidioides immitis (strain RS) TaxID=246410 RepID=J3K4I5_COCIM|nr:uncharacterized protein CIMG_07968 [Coccidioides immitis RS]EAS29222.3 hypothetical protein CIMG_07968 [Coccidioides immitis RS]
MRSTIARLIQFVQNLKRPWHFYHFYLEPDSLSTFGSAIFTRDKDHATLYTNYDPPPNEQLCSILWMKRASELKEDLAEDEWSSVEVEEMVQDKKPKSRVGGRGRYA